MPGYRTQVLVNFVVRAVIGTALIFFVNQFLNARGIDIRVGMNPVTVVTWYTGSCFIIWNFFL